MPSYGTWRTHIGFAPETSYGSTVTAATVFIPALSIDDYTDDQGIVLDDANRATPTKVFAAYSGVKQGKFGATFPYYPQQSGRFWMKFLGNDLSPTSSNGGWQHNITLNSSANPLSDTVHVFTGSTSFERLFSGAVYESLDFKFSRGTGMATVKVTGISAAPTTSAAITEETPSYSSDFALRGWQGTFALGGSTQTTLIDFEANITRKVELIFAGNNSAYPSAYEAGELDCKGKMKLYGSTSKPYDDYKALTNQSLDLVLVDSTAGNTPGSTINRFEFTASKVIFTKVTPNMTGTYLTYDVEWQAIANSSVGGDSGPFQILTTVTSSSI